MPKPAKSIIVSTEDITLGYYMDEDGSTVTITEPTQSKAERFPNLPEGLARFVELLDEHVDVKSMAALIDAAEAIAMEKSTTELINSLSPLLN